MPRYIWLWHSWFYLGLRESFNLYTQVFQLRKYAHTPTIYILHINIVLYVFKYIYFIFIYILFSPSEYLIIYVLSFHSPNPYLSYFLPWFHLLVFVLCFLEEHLILFYLFYYRVCAYSVSLISGKMAVPFTVPAQRFSSYHILAKIWYDLTF